MYRRCGKFQAHSCEDIAGITFIDIFSFISVHLQEAADAFLFVFSGVIDVGAAFQCSGVDPEEGQFTDEGVGHDFKGQGAEGSVVVGFPNGIFLVIGIETADSGNIQR